MRGEVHFSSSTPEATAAECLRLLEAELRAARPAHMKAEENAWVVRGGFLRFVSNWNLLVPVTRAIFYVNASQSGVTVAFHAVVTELVAACAVFTVAFAVPLSQQPHWQHLLIAFGLPWGWLFGANYLLTRWRLIRMLKRVARAAQAET